MNSPRSVAVLGVFVVWGCAGCAGMSPLDRAQEAYDAGDLDGSIAVTTELIVESGGPPSAYLLRGKAYEKKGDLPRAIDDYDHARQGDPANGEATVREAHVYLAAGRPAEASKLVEDSLRDAYGNYSLRDQMLTHAVHGEVCLAVQDFPGASESLGQAVSVARHSKPLEAEGATGVVYYNLSRAQFELGAFKASREAYVSYLDLKKGLGASPDEKDLYTLAVLHFLCGDIPESKKIAGSLGAPSRARLEGILAGDTFSVKALYDLKHRRDEKDAAADSNP